VLLPFYFLSDDEVAKATYSWTLRLTREVKFLQLTQRLEHIRYLTDVIYFALETSLPALVLLVMFLLFFMVLFVCV